MQPRKLSMIEIRLAQNDSEIVALQFRLGQLYEQNLRDIDSAISVYDEILKADGGHEAPRLVYEPVDAEEGRELVDCEDRGPRLGVLELGQDAARFGEPAQVPGIPAFDDNAALVR